MGNKNAGVAGATWQVERLREDGAPVHQQAQARQINGTASLPWA